jgi:hypothetical protein
MPKILTEYKPEIIAAITKFQAHCGAIILRRYIEEDIRNFPGNYPKLATLDELSRKKAITAIINRLPGTEVYRKRPASWIVTDCQASEGVYG